MKLKDITGREVANGDTVQFEMPGFCSGDYIYKAKKITKIIFPKAPPKILEGCISFKIIKRRKGTKT